MTSSSSDADDPVQLTRLLVAAEDDHAEHVQHGRDDDHARAPVVEPAEKGSRREPACVMYRTLSHAWSGVGA